MKRFKYLTMAALVAFAACDEGEETLVTPPIQGSISGVVTIEGAPASGVAVGLSTGATTTTDGSGAFTFSGVLAGAYTVTISGFADDVTFGSTSKAATIASSGQVATANFDGAYVRTSAVLGAVAAGGVGLANVSISLSGPSAGNTVTDGNGQYSFSGLRAGSYTVSMSNPDASMYEFASMSSTLTVGTGESEVVNFSGSLLATAKIEGWIFLDENDKDDMRTAGFEDDLTVANIQIIIEGIQVAMFDTLQTDANGYFMRGDLEAGPYRVMIDAADTDIPAMVAYGGASTEEVINLTTGSTGTVNFPFDIITQTIHVYGMLGTDADVSATPGPGQNPIEDWDIDLYDTYANALAGGATGMLDSEDTDANGMVTFRFPRASDISPNSAETDLVVFAAAAGPGALGSPSGTHTISGENVIEIKYAAKDSAMMANDTLDALNTAITVKLHAAEIDYDTLAGWGAVMRARIDSVIGGVNTGSGDQADANGDAMWDITPAFLAGLGDGADGVLPDTMWFKLRETQAGANGHAFMMTPQASMYATDVGRFIRYIWDGTTPAGDTVHVGTQKVTYLDSDVMLFIHHERDDSTDMPTYTGGDDTGNVDAGTELELFNTASTPASVAGPTSPTAGAVTWLNVAMGSYTGHARSLLVGGKVLNDTTIAVEVDGSDQTYMPEQLAGSAGSSAFAFKTTNNTVNGTILADDGTGAADLIVTLTPTADNIQGSAEMMDTTSAAGAYAFTDVVEGPYYVTVANEAGTWEFFDTLTLTTTPVSGTATNMDEMTAMRDVEGFGVTEIANFQPDAMDTEIHGVVVNDRDSDFNTLDPNEALSGVTINLIDDADGDGAIDTGEATIATTSTDIDGAYSFTALREGDYIVQALSPANATVLRALSGTGAVTNIVGVTTEAGVGNCALADCTNQDDTKTVGTIDPPGQMDEFPRWDYTTGLADVAGAGAGAGGPNQTNGALTTAPTHFVHLFANGTVRGEITAAGVGVEGVRVTITRCQDATTNGIVTPPAGFATGCDTKHGVPSPHIQNADTDANGDYTFNDLLEGTYQLDVAPATAGYSTNEGPDGVATNGDEIIMIAIQGSDDVETVPAYEIS